MILRSKLRTVDAVPVAWRGLRLQSRCFQFLSPHQLIIGGGSATRDLMHLVYSLGVQRPLLVTDPFMWNSGNAQNMIAPLEQMGMEVGVYHEISPETSTTDVMRGVDAFKRGEHDGLIALGGGPPIDTAKVIGIMSANSGHIRDYKVPNPVPFPGPPLIAVPTTAGSGSEVTRAAVVTDEESRERIFLMSHYMIPTAAVVDYTLTMACPYRLTADNAMDALANAIEAYVSVKANEMSNMNAREAIGTITRHVRNVCTDPRHELSRQALMLASMKAGLAFSNASVALVHAMSLPLGVHFRVPHGLSNAMLLPTVTQFSIPAAPKRYAECARMAGFAEEGDDDARACAALVRELRKLNEDLKVPCPHQFGIDEEKYMELRPLMAQQALASGSPSNNPRTATAEEIVELYTAAYRSEDV